MICFCNYIVMYKKYCLFWWYDCILIHNYCVLSNIIILHRNLRNYDIVWLNIVKLIILECILIVNWKYMQLYNVLLIKIIQLHWLRYALYYLQALIPTYNDIHSYILFLYVFTIKIIKLSQILLYLMWY